MLSVYIHVMRGIGDSSLGEVVDESVSECTYTLQQNKSRRQSKRK